MVSFGHGFIMFESTHKHTGFCQSLFLRYLVIAIKQKDNLKLLNNDRKHTASLFSRKLCLGIPIHKKMSFI